MISHEHKFIFLHIPKTAGTSMLEALSEYLHLSSPAKFRYGHPKLEEYFDSFNDKYNLEEYFIFSFCRNPFDRLVSAFNYIQGGGVNRFDERLRDDLGLQNLEFKEFALNLLNQDLPEHFMPQVNFFAGRNLNFVGKFENIQQDFDIVCDKIGIPRQKLPHRNKRNHKHYTEYYDDETRQIVAEKYAKDIEYFGYKFEE